MIKLVVAVVILILAGVLIAWNFEIGPFKEKPATASPPAGR